MSDATITTVRQIMGLETIDLGDTIPPKKPTRKGSARWLFGSLGVAGVQHVMVNFGLMRMECQRCCTTALVDQDGSFRDFQNQVQTFASRHSDCLDASQKFRYPGA